MLERSLFTTDACKGTSPGKSSWLRAQKQSKAQAFTCDPENYCGQSGFLSSAAWISSTRVARPPLYATGTAGATGAAMDGEMVVLLMLPSVPSGAWEAAVTPGLSAVNVRKADFWLRERWPSSGWGCRRLWVGGSWLACHFRGVEDGRGG
eukprot:1138321-Pelagomonas_calceolata.AAC.1